MFQYIVIIVLVLVIAVLWVWLKSVMNENSRRVTENRRLMADFIATAQTATIVEVHFMVSAHKSGGIVHYFIRRADGMFYRDPTAKQPFLFQYTYDRLDAKKFDVEDAAAQFAKSLGYVKVEYTDKM